LSRETQLSGDYQDMIGDMAAAENTGGVALTMGPC